MNKDGKRPVFSNHFTTVLTMIGVAVGLGNVWRFPYMMGKYGGSAFLLVYLLFTLLFAVPALMAEMSLGRATRKGPVGAFKAALGERGGKWIGYLLLVTILVASSYYVVVIANVIFTTFFVGSYGFNQGTIPSYEAQLGNGWLQYGIAVLALLLTLWILQRGLKKGIEQVSRLFVPFFLVVIVYLIMSAFALEGARSHFQTFLRPDFRALTPLNIFAALGQAFYSLSLGGTFMVMYGSYLKKEEKLIRLGLLTSAGDVGAALLASLFVVPTVLVFGLDLASGPGLIFSTLPRLFEVMPGGQWIGFLFLLALSLVALLSLIAALEVAVGCLFDIGEGKWRRGRLILVVGSIDLLLALPSALQPDLIGWLDLIFGSGMQVLGAGLAVVGMSWGLGKLVSLSEVFGSKENRQSRLYFFWLQWLVPGVLLMVLIGYIYSSIFGK